MLDVWRPAAGAATSGAPRPTEGIGERPPSTTFAALGGGCGRWQRAGVGRGGGRRRGPAPLWEIGGGGGGAACPPRLGGGRIGGGGDGAPPRWGGGGGFGVCADWQDGGGGRPGCRGRD